MPSPEQLLMLIVAGCAAAVALVLRVMRGKWSDVKWSDPTILAAIIAGSAALGVAVAGAISGSISAAYQSAAAAEKNKGDLLVAALLKFNPQKSEPDNQKDLAQRVKILIQSGIIPDDSGSICRAFVKDFLKTDCPLTKLDKP